MSRPTVLAAAPPAVLLPGLLRLARPGQWPKNILVISVPLLDPLAWNLPSLAGLVCAVAAFTLSSVLVYVLNDLADRHRDAANPARRHRPIASGAVSPAAAAGFALLVSVLLVVTLLWFTPATGWPVAAYLLLNVAYSLGLKHVPLLDVFLISGGFILRLLQGHLAAGTDVAGWLFTSVLTLCLLLALGKRRQELLSTGHAHRPALRGYTVGLTEQLMLLSATLTAASYLLYLHQEAPHTGSGTLGLILLAPPALFALFRYLQLVLVQNKGGNPVHTLVRDPVLVANTALWAALSGLLVVVAQGTL
ncbi:UbiA prenyltransferase family protein [Catenuloplanes indicus]|uniref:4-hydroxybenzoate polyprenyltransferase n=1 Tax=Catenuloplanes indicus TaxID=137267 RepID=A0AAE3VVV9_9ACTN|nr:UbiA prenyltransferase family protein [Catenuloplanes indicus]MDQ0363940.1 4-hydroxybenzoate polyprenyltransferase [Catenuloplanes indicus]